MTRKCDGVTLPDYYTIDTRRPNMHQTGYISADEMAWDMSDHWRTASEWLAWIRRKDKRPCYFGRAQKLHYPMRPEVAAHCRPMSNLKRRVLP